jgi:hypothetical protein
MISLLLHVYHCSGKVDTEPLPTSERGIQIQTHRLMRGIYEVRCSDGLRCHNIDTEFQKDWFRHSKVDGGGYTDSMVIS